MICEKVDCNNDTYDQFDQCVLHCEKTDSCSLILLEDFFKLLKDYCDPVIEKSNQYYNMHLMTHDRIMRYISFDGFKFPNVKHREKMSFDIDYFNILKSLTDIDFIECTFSSDIIELPSIVLYFEKCIFENIFHISEYKSGSSNNGYIFNRCVFNKDIKNYVGQDLVIDVPLFKNCSFKGDLIFNNVVFVKGFIEEIKSGLTFEKIRLENCLFRDKIKINYCDIKNLEIIDTNFLSKLEIKHSDIEELIFDNSNVEEIFDAYKSIIKKSCFHKVIFFEFAGFEKVVFGNKDLNYPTRFIYTTFKDFSNFRGAEFNSGLDFSSVNLKEPPNFLNSNIEENETNRETFRIIKDSFEKVNNHLEANRFFVYEMNAYKKEAKTKKSRAINFIININYFISRFGASYIRPSVILLIFLSLYSGIVYLQKNIFIGENYLLPIWFEKFSTLANNFAINFMPFSIFIEKRKGIELISLFFYICFTVLTWQIIVAIKRHTQH